jgi:hypothetical protein
VAAGNPSRGLKEIPPLSEDLDRRAGLCARCRHASRVPTSRSLFWLCRLSAQDPRFERYPRLPVLECAGHEPGEPETLARLPATDPGPQGPAEES